jgi:D-glycero-alpha-D-manno-heptose-7-phosphate kinase
MPFRVTTPNRVDLAGGTLDIYPLYLLIADATTVNAAISVRSVVDVRPFRRGSFRLHSRNYGVSARSPDSHGIPLDGTLGLLSRALRRYPAVTGAEIIVRNEAPIGSGIGASSALLVALMLAMGRLTGSALRWADVSRTASEIEAAHLRTLTGRQDHLAALRGGIQGIRFTPGRVEARRLSPRGEAGAMLARHGFLAHTGVAHHSADVNWRMIRGAIGGDAAVLRKFRGIAAAAVDAWGAVSSADADALGASVSDEWAIRRTLAPGVTIRKVDAQLGARSFRRVVSGAKLCGAGGGGMLFGLLRDPSRRPELEALLAAAGMEPVPFRPCGGALINGITDVG